MRPRAGAVAAKPLQRDAITDDLTRLEDFLQQ
jgi:hypothetical protein